MSTAAPHRVGTFVGCVTPNEGGSLLLLSANGPLLLLLGWWVDGFGRSNVRYVKLIKLQSLSRLIFEAADLSIGASESQR